jgi:hypothetical protein
MHDAKLMDFGFRNVQGAPPVAEIENTKPEKKVVAQ